MLQSLIDYHFDVIDLTIEVLILECKTPQIRTDLVRFVKQNDINHPHKIELLPPTIVEEPLENGNT